MKGFDIVSIGDTTHDIFVELDENDADVNCEIDPHECKLLLSWGDKLPVKKLTHVPAVGNAANNAVGMARMGFNNSLYTNLGDDQTGEEALEIFHKEGVKLDFVDKHKNHPSNLSIVINYKGERVILVHHEDWKYKLPDIGSPKWIYYTSVGEGHENLNKEVLSFVKKTKPEMGFNPGTYQMKKGLKELKPLMAVTTAFIVNKEEMQRILDTKEKNVKKLLTMAKKICPKVVVITDGPKGTYACDNDNYWYLGVNDVPVIERTGVGDAFSTGFTSALMREQPVEEAMRWGSLNSESVLQYIGAQKGLLTYNQMRECLKKHKNYKAKKI